LRAKLAYNGGVLAGAFEETRRRQENTVGSRPEFIKGLTPYRLKAPTVVGDLDNG